MRAWSDLITLINAEKKIICTNTNTNSRSLLKLNSTDLAVSTVPSWAAGKKREWRLIIFDLDKRKRHDDKTSLTEVQIYVNVNTFACIYVRSHTFSKDEAHIDNVNKPQRPNRSVRKQNTHKKNPDFNKSNSNPSTHTKCDTEISKIIRP